MNYAKIGTRYAKALYLSALEENALENVYHDMQVLQQITTENPSFISFLKTPILKPSEKKQFFESVFSNYVHPLVLRFLFLLTEHRRENRLIDIIRNFYTLYLKNKNTVSVNLITTIKADDAMINLFKEKLQQILHKTILLQNTIDDKIAGGFILQIEDKEFDASVKTQLNKIKNNLMKTSL